MAIKRKIRRKLRRKSPAVRKRPDASAQAMRDQAAGSLVIGGAHDPAEKAADQMAAKALSGGPAGKGSSGLAQAIRRKCADCAKDDKTVKRKAVAAPMAAGTGAVRAPKSAQAAVTGLGTGKPLSRSERSFFEPRFGRDFADVRVHEGAQADAANAAVDARAFSLGSDIAFAQGEKSRETMAHELAHVVQNGTALRRLDRCTSRTDQSAIVSAHTTNATEIDEPGDTVTAKVSFGCKPRSFKSEFVDMSGNAFLTKVVTADQLNAAGEYEREWTGKKGYKSVGTFMAPDGFYTHQLRAVAYAPGPTADLQANDGGILSTSPTIEVKTRGAVSATGENHLNAADGSLRQDNVDLMAAAIRSEAGIGNATEKEAIGWAIKNGMMAVNSYKVADAKAKISFAAGDPGTDADIAMAKDILGKDASKDTTKGAIKWYSPQSMPPHNSNCSASDCTGGTVELTDEPGKSSKAPGFHKHMTFVPLAGVRQWYFRFYKL